jgi:hypothetical protein
MGANYLDGLVGFAPFPVEQIGAAWVVDASTEDQIPGAVRS